MPETGRPPQDNNRRTLRFRWDVLGVVAPIVFFCAIVVFPITKIWIESRRSARQLQEASSLLERGELDEAERLWHEFGAANGRFMSDAFRERMEVSFLVIRGESEKVLDRIRSVSGEDQYYRAALAYDVFFSVADFTNALECAKIMSKFPNMSTVEKLNLTAYLRALAGIELDVALRDINLITKDSQPPELLDTKAWVLYALERYEEALPIINQAIESIERTVSTKDSAIPKDGLESTWPKTDDATNPESFEEMDLPERRAQHLRAYRKDEKHPLKSLAVMRFHRAKILEALSLDSDADRTWLQDHGFVNTDILH